jgi:hypothetical protein
VAGDFDQLDKILESVVFGLVAVEVLDWVVAVRMY